MSKVIKWYSAPTPTNGNEHDYRVSMLCEDAQKKSLTLNEYQKMALETAIYPMTIIYPALGLCGEAGEVADKVKKVIRDSGGEFTDERKREIAMELGDVLWYCATLSKDLGYSLEEVAKMNYDKLRSRKERGKIGWNGDNR